MPERKPSQAFKVDYVRHDDGNNWEAVISPRPGLDNANFLGFVSYSAATWPDQMEGDERAASVSVIVECESTPESRVMALSNAVREAIQLADIHFKQRHPLASVKYADFDLNACF